MLESHLKRSNRMIFITYCVTTFFMLVGLISQLQFSELQPILSIIPIVVTAITFVGGIVMYISKKNTYTFTTYVAVAFSICYAVIMLTSSTNNVYPYMIPFLILFILSMNKKIVYGSSIWLIVINVVKLILEITKGVDASNIEPIMIEAIISILITLVSFLGINIITDFFNASVAEASEAADANKAISDKIVQVVAEVNTDLRSANSSFSTIQTSMDSLTASMREISNAIVANTESISDETAETQSIKSIIDATNEQMEEAVRTADETMEMVTVGATSMSSLMQHVETAIEAGDQMKDSALGLQERANEVRSITELIITISNQTNLLALNASIEAARAGEAGKGFAVVADQIRNLAEQTKQATENITSILDELAVNATEVVERVEQNVDLSREQSTYANEASTQFSNIEEIITQLHTMMSEVAGQMIQIANSNDMIVDSVSSLSASSEQMTAGVQEATAMCDTNLSVVQEFSDYLNSITESLASLE